MAVTILTYEELEELVIGHRSGDKLSTGKLLHAWEAWFSKYMNLLKYGRWKMTDKNLRDFIALYMPPERRARIHTFMRNAYARIDMEQAVDLIRQIFGRLHPHEIENELKVAFLTLAARYKSHGNYFHIYINRSFHFQLHRQLKNVADMASIAAVDGGHLCYWDDLSEGEGSDQWADHINEAAGHRFYINEPDDDINENWVNGLTTVDDIFDDLTKTQRRILKLHYVDGHTDGQISELMGTCRATVNRRRLKAVAHITPYFEQQRVITT